MGVAWALIAGWRGKYQIDWAIGICIELHICIAAADLKSLCRVVGGDPAPLLGGWRG